MKGLERDQRRREKEILEVKIKMLRLTFFISEKNVVWTPFCLAQWKTYDKKKKQGKKDGYVVARLA